MQTRPCHVAAPDHSMRRSRWKSARRTSPCTSSTTVASLRLNIFELRKTLYASLPSVPVSQVACPEVCALILLLRHLPLAQPPPPAAVEGEAAPVDIYEERRTREQQDDYWQETFKGHTDRKPYGTLQPIRSSSSSFDQLTVCGFQTVGAARAHLRPRVRRFGRRVRRPNPPVRPAGTVDRPEPADHAVRDCS